jgi:imidazolonepropionase-like amidohydrolase
LDLWTFCKSDVVVITRVTHHIYGAWSNDLSAGECITEINENDKKKTTTLSLFIALSLVACSAITSESKVNQMDKYAITKVSVVDVEKGVIIPDQTVIVAEGRIEQVGAASQIKVPREAKIIDGEGLYLMPGLVDAHVHYFDAPIFGRLMIANGVLLVRDMGMPNEYILPLRDQLNRGETLGPEMVAAGSMLDGNPPMIPPIATAVRTPEEARVAVRQQAEAGADMIKVYSALEPDVFLAIMDEAKKQDIKVVGHIPDMVYLEDAVAAGQGSIEHWFGFQKVIAKLLGEPVDLNHGWMSSGADYLIRIGEVDRQALHDFYQRLEKSGVTIVPTVVTFRNLPNVDKLELQNLPHGEYISTDLFSMWKAQWAGQTEMPDAMWQGWAQMVRQMNEAGIPLMVGTDLMCPGLVPGYSVHEEMLIWQEAGIPPADILRSAMLVPAQFMDLGDRLGSISEGKAASMILMRANPLEDIRNAQQIESVFLRGQYFSRADLDRLLDEAKELAQPVGIP